MKFEIFKFECAKSRLCVSCSKALLLIESDYRIYCYYDLAWGGALKFISKLHSKINQSIRSRRLMVIYLFLLFELRSEFYCGNIIFIYLLLLSIIGSSKSIETKIHYISNEITRNNDTSLKRIP